MSGKESPETKEKRSNERFDFLSTIDYVLSPSDSGEIYKGVTINISTSGLAAYVFTPHPEGQKIVVKSNLPAEARTATVRWIKKEDESFFMTGLKFVDRVSH